MTTKDCVQTELIANTGIQTVEIHLDPRWTRPGIKYPSKTLYIYEVISKKVFVYPPVNNVVRKEYRPALILNVRNEQSQGENTLLI